MKLVKLKKVVELVKKLKLKLQAVKKKVSSEKREKKKLDDVINELIYIIMS